MTDPGEHHGPAGLDAALAAARRRFDGRSESAQETEGRILAAVQPGRRTRKSFWLVAVAAAFFGSVAFAEELAEGLSRLEARLLASHSATPAPPPPARARSARAVLSESSAARNPSATVAPPSEASPPTQRARAGAAAGSSNDGAPGPRTKALASPAPNLQAPPPSAPAANPPDDLALYKAAHAAHFTDHDYARALTAWDRYLSRAPRGTFALEARYNRAIALHRLGRRQEALEALTPFAEGAYGRYRQEEARELIETLR